jgi:hypothetical protein
VVPLEEGYKINKIIGYREQETHLQKIGEAAAKRKSQEIIEEREHIHTDTIKEQEAEYHKEQND